MKVYLIFDVIITDLNEEIKLNPKNLSLFKETKSVNKYLSDYTISWMNQNN